MEFKIGEHIQNKGPVVEVWKEGEFVACIYGHDDGMRIVSKYLDGTEHEVGYPPSVVIKLSK